MSDALTLLMLRPYHIRHYNCWHFACDVWYTLCGHNIVGLFLQQAFVISTSAKDRLIKLESPVSPCLVVFRRKTSATTHVGVYYEGRVLHHTPNGARYEQLNDVKKGYAQWSYYNVKP